MRRTPLEATLIPGMQTTYTSRIVCLSADSADILFELGAADRIVGVTAFAGQKATAIPRVSGFSTVQFDKIDALKPDLVIAFSDVQADAARELIRRGHNVLTTNQRSLADIFQTILLLGRIVDKAREAENLVDGMRAEIFDGAPVAGKRESCNLPLRPDAACLGLSEGRVTRAPLKVYFEEWDEPLIAGIRWVSELIEAAGARDIFEHLRDRAGAHDRQVTSSEVIRRQPDIIIASWCGKKVDTAAIASRAGWAAIPAVRNQRIYEIHSDDLLQPGPSILKGFRRLRKIIWER